MLQSMIPYGTVDFEGNKWPDAWVDQYNNLSKKINELLAKKAPKGSLTDISVNFYLDQRHRVFVQFLEICRKEKAKKAAEMHS